MRYSYQVAANTQNAYEVQEAKSLRAAIEKLEALAAGNGDLIDQKVFRNEFRKPTMIKVGYNIDNAEYAIFRYANGTDIPNRPTMP